LQGKEKHEHSNAPNSSPCLPTRIPILWCCWKRWHMESPC
jgi:hypothetical protein